jgi:hypothetical protein
MVVTGEVTHLDDLLLLRLQLQDTQGPRLVRSTAIRGPNEAKLLEAMPRAVRDLLRE